MQSTAVSTRLAAVRMMTDVDIWDLFGYIEEECPRREPRDHGAHGDHGRHRH
jgi:hypothetical protein